MPRTDQATTRATTASAGGGGEPRAVRIFSLTVCTAALAAGGVLLAAGAELPAPGPVLLLALAAALCVNHFVLFPSEHAATAEAAVLLAAVVGFRDEAVFLGPLVVALLVGPLDALHWEQRSFLRMAYNAGNRGLATLAATTAFVIAHDLLGGSPAAWGVVVLMAASALVLVDELVSATLLVLTGEPFAPALRFVFAADALALPIACLGAAAGFLAAALGWWATALLLVPIAFLPEFVVARTRTRPPDARDVAVLSAIVAALTTFALVTPLPSVATLAVLAAIAALAGVEFGIDRHTVVPPMVAVVVIAAVATVSGAHARFAAGLVATVATTVSWWTTADASRARFLAAVATALGAAVLTAELAVQLPHTMSGVALGAAVAGLGFEAVAVLTGSRRRQRGVAVLWSLPLLAAALGWAMVWRSLEVTGGGIVFAAALAATCAGAAWWGAPTWCSRVLRRVTTHLPPRLLFVTLVAVATAAVLSAVVGVVAHQPVLAVDAAWVSAGLGDSAVAMAALGVRQWRFAPRPRVAGLIVLLLVAGAFASAVPALVIEGSWWGPVVAVVSVAAVAAIARRPATRARAVPIASEQEEVPLP